MKKIFICAFCALLIGHETSLAQDAIMRPYLGVSAGNAILAGSFDGKTFFQTDEDMMLVPKIKPAFGFGGVLGLRVNNGAGEIGYYYYKSEYTTMDGDYSGNCVTHLIRILGITKYLNAYADRTVSPYFDVDMSLSYSVCEKIAYPIGFIGEPISGNYGGFIIGVGGGILVNFSKKLVMDIKILPEYYTGTDIRVKGRDRYEITKFSNLLLQSTIGFKYFFKTRII